ncbi:MAG: hypothetical protein JW801_16505 [Bacteroidales bacterium]|nr:hypothetical protein [Bacteroidales bacterium]
MYKLFLSATVLIILLSCSTDTVKKKVNKAGQIAGSVTGEFVEGASKSIEDAFNVQLEINGNLKAKGLEFGKCMVSDDSTGEDNLLTAYVIFNKDFNDTLIAKAFDDHSLEMGRAFLPVKGTENETRYLEFHFDKHTNIDSDSRLTIE